MGQPGSLLRTQRSRGTLQAQRVVPVLAIVVLIIAVVTAFDVVLVRVASQHSAESGVQLFEAGLAAKRTGKTAEALEYFRSAFNRRPRDPEYHLAFAQALLAAGRTREGRAALDELLARKPAYGEANAEMARLLAESGDWQTAAWFYHRAIYGEWTRSPNLRSLRYELADLLARHDAREQLVAEVVLLNAEPAEPREAKHLAGLQLAAGEWRRAEQLYRTLLRGEPDDAELLAGMARAQMGLGRYSAAERGFRRALSAGAAPDKLARDLELVRTVTSMDPTVRGLTPDEKHNRAHELSTEALSSIRRCSPQNQIVTDSERVLQGHDRTKHLLAAAEADLDVFDRLFAARESICNGDAQLPRPVELLGAHLSH
jgi:Flp pilus assembly protein TadD